MKSFSLLLTKRLSPELIEELEHQGIKVLQKEFIEIVTLNKCKEIKETYNSETAVAFTSQNAVKAVASCNFIANWKIFCLQGATRAAATEYLEENNIAGTAANAKALASLILSEKKYKKIVFFCGNRRRNELPELLERNNIELEEITVYETKLRPQKISEKIDGAVFFSPSGAESFFSANTIDHQVICFSIGETTTDALKKYTSNRIITSEKPSEKNIVEAILEYNRNCAE